MNQTAEQPAQLDKISRIHPGARALIIVVLTIRDGPYCWLCRGHLHSIKDITLDHLIPRSQHGSNHLSNLKMAHGRCNVKRDTKTWKQASRFFRKKVIKHKPSKRTAIQRVYDMLLSDRKEHD